MQIASEDVDLGDVELAQKGGPGSKSPKEERFHTVRRVRGEVSQRVVPFFEAPGISIFALAFCCILFLLYMLLYCGLVGLFLVVGVVITKTNLIQLILCF